MKKTYTSFLIATAFLFSGCGDTTETPVVADIDHIAIDTPPVTSLYATTDELNLTARVYLNDNSDFDITDSAVWMVSDYDKASIYGGTLSPSANGDGNGSVAEVEVILSYRDFNDTYTPIRIIPLQSVFIDDSNITDKNDINTSLTYTLKAFATYGETNTTLQIGPGNSKNISWIAEGNATVEVTDGIATVTFSGGEANITVVAFEHNETKVYTAPLE